MPGAVIGKEMGLGYAGSCARLPYFTIMNRLVSGADIPFGAPVVLNADNTWSLFGTSNTAAQFAGVAVREVKQATNFLNQNEVFYKEGQACDVLEQGNIIVKVGRGTPAAGGPVYLRTAVNASYPGSEPGDFEAAADGANSVLLTNAAWETGRIDPSGLAELVIKYRV
jgi:hypothetical protein